MPKRIFAPNLPTAAPYAHAVQANGFLYTSGQIPFCPKKNELVTGDIERETRQVFENLQAVLKAGKRDFSHVIKATIFLTDLDAHFTAVNEVYAQYFDAKKLPARSCVQVAALPMGARVEIELIAAY